MITKRLWSQSIVMTLYYLFKTIDSCAQKLPTTLELLSVFEYLMMVYCCVRPIFLSSTQNFSETTIQIFNNVDDRITIKSPSQILFISFTFGSSIFFLVLVFLRFRIINKSIIQYVSWILTLVCLFSRIIWYWIIDQLFVVFVDSGENYPILNFFRYPLVLPIIIYILYMNVIFRKEYVYGVLHSFAPLTFFIESNLILIYSIPIAMFIYVNVLNKKYRYRIFCNSMMVIVAWAFLKYKVNYIHYPEIIIVGLCFICGNAHYFYKHKNISLTESHVEELQKIKQVLKKQKDKVQIQNELFIHELIIHFHMNLNQFQLQNQQYLTELIKKKEVTSINNIFCLKLIEILQNLNKDQQNQLLIFIYSMKLQHEKDHYKTLLSLHETYYDEQSFNFLYKYELAKLLLSIESFFQRHKQYSSESFQIISLESIIKKFYDNMEDSLKFLLEAWSSLDSHIIDFKKVWGYFKKSIKLKQQSQRILKNMGKKFKRIQQFVKYNSVMQLFNFPKFNIHTFQNLAIDTQQRASYIRVWNNKITKLSLQFESLFLYSNQEINELDVNKLSPFKTPLLSELSILQNLKIKDERHPILDSCGYLHLVHLEAFIDPAVSDTIQYVVFLSPIFTTTEAYFLYDVDSDIIQQVSKGFTEAFKLDISLFHNFTHKPLFAKHIFQELDFHSQETIQQLLTEKGIITEINVANLVEKYDNQDCRRIMVKIIEVFEAGGLKYLVRIKTKQYDQIQSDHGTVQLQTQQNFSVFTKELQKDRIYSNIMNKKANLKAQSKVKRYIASIGFAMIIVVFIIVSGILFHYSCFWFSFLRGYIELMNTRSIQFLQIFLQTFNIMHLLNYQPSQMSKEKIQSLVEISKVQLQNLILSIQQSAVYSLVTIHLPFVSNNIEEYGYSLKSTQNNLDLFFNIMYSAPLLYTQSMVSLIIEKTKQCLDFALNQGFIKPYQKLLQRFKLTNIIIVGLGVLFFPVIKIFNILKIKKNQSSLVSVQQLFGFIRNQQVAKKVNATKKSINKLRKPLQQQVFKINQTVVQVLNFKSEQNLMNEIKEVITYQQILPSASIIVTQTLLVCVFCFLLINNSIVIKNQFQTIIKHQFNISIEEIKVKSQILILYYNILNNKTGYGPQINLIQNTSLIETTVLQSFELPQFFNHYSQNTWKKANQNLCLLDFKNSDRSRCQQLLRGIMKKGPINVLQIFWNELNIISLRQLDDMYMDDIFDDAKFIEKYLIAFLKQIRKEFVELQNRYLTEKTFEFTTKAAIGIVVVIVYVLLNYLNQKWYTEKKFICESLFNLFPQQNFKRQEVKKFMNRSNLIQRLTEI